MIKLKRVYVDWNFIYRSGKSSLDEIAENVLRKKSTELREVIRFSYEDVDLILVEIKTESINYSSGMMETSKQLLPLGLYQISDSFIEHPLLKLEKAFFYDKDIKSYGNTIKDSILREFPYKHLKS